MLILEEIHKKFGGAANEAAETATGSWVQAKNAVGDLNFNSMIVRLKGKRFTGIDIIYCISIQ
mgnify:CR=1 FL=1